MRSFSQYLWTVEKPVWAYQSGLFFANGKPKPALASYRLPIYVRRAGIGVVVWLAVGYGMIRIWEKHVQENPDR